MLAERCAASRRVGFRLGVGMVLGQTDEFLAASAAEARANGWAVHTTWPRSRRGRPGPPALGPDDRGAGRSIGLLEVPLVAAHCIWVHPGITALARAGAAVVHNPVANMILGSGVCPVGALRQAGLPVGSAPTGPPPTTARTCWRRSRRPPCSGSWPARPTGPDRR